MVPYGQLKPEKNFGIEQLMDEALQRTIKSWRSSLQRSRRQMGKADSDVWRDKNKDETTRCANLNNIYLLKNSFTKRAVQLITDQFLGVAAN